MSADSSQCDTVVQCRLESVLHCSQLEWTVIDGNLKYLPTICSSTVMVGDDTGERYAEWPSGSYSVICPPRHRVKEDKHSKNTFLISAFVQDQTKTVIACSRCAFFLTKCVTIQKMVGVLYMGRGAGGWGWTRKMISHYFTENNTNKVDDADLTH